METFHCLRGICSLSILTMYARKLKYRHLQLSLTRIKKKKNNRLMDAQIMIKKIWQNVTCRIEVIIDIGMFIIELFCMLEILY